MHGNEFRRAPRFKVSLRVQITGIDAAPVLRRGDISASGLYLDFDREVGTVGSMQRLQLSAHDGSCPVVVLARIVRIAAIEDFWQGRKVAGVAFQFMFAEEPGISPMRNTAHPVSESAAFQRLLRTLMTGLKSQSGISIRSLRGVVHTSDGTHEASLNDLSLRGMVLETDYAVPSGETIRVELPGRTLEERLSFDGLVLESVEREDGDGTRFRTVVRFGDGAPNTDKAPAAEGETIDDALEALLDAFTSLPPPAPRERHASHLAGELSRISLTSVLTLCQIERVTGVLKLESGTSRVRCYLRGGELVDVVLDGRDVPPRDALSEVMCWQDGTFAVSFEPVVRQDRLGVATTPLLLDLAREIDETRRGA